MQGNNMIISSRMLSLVATFAVLLGAEICAADPSPDLLEQARLGNIGSITTLAQFADTGSRDILQSLVGRDDIAVRTRALAALAARDVGDSRARLNSMISGEDHAASAIAMDAIGAIDNPYRIAVLRTQLDDDRPRALLSPGEFDADVGHDYEPRSHQSVRILALILPDGPAFQRDTAITPAILTAWKQFMQGR